MLNDPSFLDMLLDNTLGFFALAIIAALLWTALMDAINRREGRESRLTKKRLPIARLTWAERFPRRR